jgi:2-phospho-L-lactate guanylyltransferase (CobY/MobA/RfbA family)
LSLDIDDRSDLVALLAEGSDTESARLVATWSGAGRLPVVSRR